MQITGIKELEDKSPIGGVEGIVEKQYPPADQTENDKKWGQKRQSILIADDSGEKLMVTLMREQIHILDDIEGKKIKLTAGRNEKGEDRGLLLNRWRPADAQFDKIVLRVYPEATIKVVGKDAATVATSTTVDPDPRDDGYSGVRHPDEPTDESRARERRQLTRATSQQPMGQFAPSRGQTKFHDQVNLAAVGYEICLSKAQEIINAHEGLKADPTNLRAIATNFWLDAKHHVHTLKTETEAPASPPPAGKAKAKAKPKGPVAKPAAAAKTQTDDQLADRLVNGHRMMDEGALNVNQADALKALSKEADERGSDERGGVWDKCYDRLIIQMRTRAGADTKEMAQAMDTIFDEFEEAASGGSTEKLITCQQLTWVERVMEEFGRVTGS